MVPRTAPGIPASVDSFVARHIGPTADEQRDMLDALGYSSIDAFIDAVVPESIRFRGTLATGPERTEADVLGLLRALGAKNRRYRSFIGLGYAGTHTPAVGQDRDGAS